MAIATPTVNPLDIPSPLPSEIIRSWPLRNWGKRWVKICQGGTLQLCAKGILLETAGHDWRGERSGSQTIEDVYGIPSQITYELTHVNDRDGKDAAADFLVARGFQMIDTKTLNPLDVPTAKPSEIVRNWPDAMWGVEHAKHIARDGSMRFCAIGILAETGGFEWGEPDRLRLSGAEMWYGFTVCDVSQFVGKAHGLSDNQLLKLYVVNDESGKEAAADLLASWGLQVATCQSYEIMVNPETKVPYKSFCPTELSAAAVRRGGQYCLKHRTNRGGPKPRNFQPQTPDVRGDPEARRYE